ncbi:MAG: 30S ribosomal protein S6 [Desulfovibrio sp.]|nr:30S ribosomal protein S6 [Desulfovibrio sp.]
MRKFETLLLLSPEISAESRENIIVGLKAIIEKEQGVVVEVDNWGMRDLAYPVRKLMRGFYVRLEYKGPGALVAELERNIRITDGIFKFVTVKLADEAAGEVA